MSRPWDGETTPLRMALCGHRWLAMLELGKVGALKGDSEMGERFGH
jgi:hypothetical protein